MMLQHKHKYSVYGSNTLYLLRVELFFYFFMLI